MTNNDTVLEALRASGRPMASHQLYEHPACEGLTRQQVSSAVGHLRNAGRIKETWERIPGPRFGPKLVSTYEVIPSEAELDAALVAALAASVSPDPDSPAGQAEASRLAAARVPQAERPIRRTSSTPPQAAAHPFKQPLVPKAARHGRITRDLPAHLRTPDPDGATQEAQFIAAGAAAEAEAEAAAETVADATTAPEAATAAEAQPDPIATPTEDTAIAAKTHQCSGHCQGPDQGQTARCAGHGDPCVVHADDDLENRIARDFAMAGESDQDKPRAIGGTAGPSLASDDDPPDAEAGDRPAWVAALRDWLGPLPVDLSLYQMGARIMPNDGPGEVRLKINDDGGGPFLRLDAQKLALNPGELGRLDRYSRALIWIFDAIMANSELVERPRSRPAGLDTPRIGDDFWSLPLPDGSSHADGFRTNAPF
ncbi:MAG: hypothetical protein KAY97_00180 [Chromatiaceae bacterium]|nr:hypothetical protein [Chromatiaceae bacterium]